MHKHSKYTLEDIIIVPVPPSELLRARKWAKAIGEENKGERTRDGGDDRDIKGCLAQWAVHKYLEDAGWDHTYSLPYIKDQHRDQFDLLFSDEIWDVKCRGWWKEEYYYNISILMATHEKSEAKPCDYYIFCTTDTSFNNIYILGAKSYDSTWNELQPVDQSKMRFPTAGELKSRSLTPLRKHILKN